MNTSHACLVGALLLISTGAALPSPAAEECSAWMTAWQDESPRRARKAALEESAKERAIDDLARRAFSVTFREDYLEEVRRLRSDGPGGRASYSADLLMVDVARSFYEIDAELREGNVEMQRSDRRSAVRYCVSVPRFTRARESVLARRRQLVESVRRRFGEAEKAILGRQLSIVSRTLLPDLKNDVSRAVLDAEIYSSVATAVSRSFSAWLRAWSDQVGHEQEYAIYSCDRARDAVRRAHLAEADLFVAEGLRADSHEVACLQVRDRIVQRRGERTSLLADARSTASAGRFSRANDLVACAREIDVDDRTSLDEAERDVNAARTEFLKNNPSFRIGIVLGFGGIGVDADATAAAVVPGAELSGSDFTALADLQVRLGRNVFAFGEFGLTQRSYEGPFGSSEGLYQASHWAAGLGWKSVSRGKVLVRWEVSAAVVSQAATIPAYPGEPTDRRTGALARVGLDAGHLYLFVQRTFLFDDGAAPAGPVRWGDQFLGGVGLWLH